MNPIQLQQQLEQFLLEDIGTRDITATSIFPVDAIGEGVFQAKATGIIAGLAIIRATYQSLDPNIRVVLYKKDGEHVTPGETIAKVTGSIQVILTGERVILNLLQRMSGIATMTNHAIQLLQNDKTKICDTRKTTPGLRMFEKYAVTCGGGYNHRFGLYDGVMIKDNHIAFYGSLEEAVHQVRRKLGPMVKIEVETESEHEVVTAVNAQCDIIMFDNQKPETIAEWIKVVPPTIITEASGNITLETIAAYRYCGVDFISLGCLTHSVQALDISLGGV